MYAIILQVRNSIIKPIKLKHINRIVHNYNSLVGRGPLNDVLHQSACALVEASLAEFNGAKGAYRARFATLIWRQVE